MDRVKPGGIGRARAQIRIGSGTLESFNESRLRRRFTRPFDRDLPIRCGKSRRLREASRFAGSYGNRLTFLQRQGPWMGRKILQTQQMGAAGVGHHPG